MLTYYYIGCDNVYYNKYNRHLSRGGGHCATITSSSLLDIYTVHRVGIMRVVYYVLCIFEFYGFHFFFAANNRLALYSCRRTCFEYIYIYHMYGVILCVRQHLYSIIHYYTCVGRLAGYPTHYRRHGCRNEYNIIQAYNIIYLCEKCRCRFRMECFFFFNAFKSRPEWIYRVFVAQTHCRTRPSPFNALQVYIISYIIIIIYVYYFVCTHVFLSII